MNKGCVPAPKEGVEEGVGDTRGTPPWKAKRCTSVGASEQAL